MEMFRNGRQNGLNFVLFSDFKYVCIFHPSWDDELIFSRGLEHLTRHCMFLTILEALVGMFILGDIVHRGTLFIAVAATTDVA